MAERALHDKFSWTENDIDLVPEILENRLEQMDAEIENMRLPDQDGRSVSVADAWEVGDDGEDPTRPLLLTYTDNIDELAEESEPDGGGCFANLKILAPLSDF